jgi:hypothetical protein
VLVCLVFALAAAHAAPAPVSPASAGPVTVTAVASKHEVTVGEAFTIDVKVRGPAGATYTFAGEASAEQLELRTLPPSPDAAAPELGAHRYEATAFTLGELRVPPIPVRYTLADGTVGEAASLPLTIKVGSLLPKDPAQQALADIRGPARVSIGSAFWWTLGLGLAVLAALLLVLLRRRRRARAPLLAPRPEQSPDVEALHALDALHGEALPARGELRPFYIRLSVIAKRYLERRLGAPVLEMTSAETLAFLRGHPYGDDLLPVVRDLAEAADRVKFARGQGLVPEAERHLTSVRALVPALEAKLRPAAGAPTAQERAA